MQDYPPARRMSARALVEFTRFDQHQTTALLSAIHTYKEYIYGDPDSDGQWERRQRVQRYIQELLKNKADVNLAAGGETPLMACVTSEVESRVIDILIQHGSDVNQEDDEGNTPLMIPANGNPEMFYQAEAIIERMWHKFREWHQSIVAAINYESSKTGLTALMTAVRSSHWQCINRSKWDDSDHSGSRYFEFLINRGASVSMDPVKKYKKILVQRIADSAFAGNTIDVAGLVAEYYDNTYSLCAALYQGIHADTVLVHQNHQWMRERVVEREKRMQRASTLSAQYASVLHAQ